MIRTSADLLSSLSDYGNPKNKLNRMVRDQKLYKLKRGLYTEDKRTSPYLIANAMFNPSYISFETALSYYGIIPERTYGYTSATFDKNRTQTFQNDFGTFYYRDVPPTVYPLAVRWIQEDGYGYAIATKEKALCDFLYIQPPSFSIKSFKDLIFNHLRIDSEEILSLNDADIAILAPLYNRKNINFLLSLIRSERMECSFHD